MAGPLLGHCWKNSSRGQGGDSKSIHLPVRELMASDSLPFNGNARDDILEHMNSPVHPKSSIFLHGSLNSTLLIALSPSLSSRDFGFSS